MVISSLRGPLPASPTRRPLAAAAETGGSRDQVELGPPPTRRELLWTSLQTAQVMSGEAIPSPLGKVLTEAQKQGLREVFDDLGRQGARLDPEHAFGQMMESQPVTLEYRGETWKLANLADLKDAASLTGAEPVRPAGPALLHLREQGWQIEVRRDWIENRPVTTLEAYSAVTRGDPIMTRGQEVRLAPPTGHPLAERSMWAEADVLPAVDYFYAGGSSQGLENPEVAAQLKALEDEGVTLTCWGSGRGLGEREKEAYSWYSSALRGNVLKLVEHGVEVGDFQPADVEQISVRHQEWKALDRAVVAPAVRAGLLDEGDQDDLVRLVARPVEGLSLEERARLSLSLLEADGSRNFYDARRLYEDLVDLSLPGPELRAAGERARQLAAAVGADSAREAMKFLRRELAEQVPFEPARQRSEQAFMKLVLGGAPTKLAQECLQLARTQVDGSPFETRIDELLGLHRAGLRQEGYRGLADDYRAVLENRRSGESLAEATRPLLRLLDALSAMGKAEMARDIYVLIRQGLEYGTMQGSEDELLQRFLQTLLLRDSVEQARQSLTRPPTATAPGSVQEGKESVKVGGVVVRRKKT